MLTEAQKRDIADAIAFLPPDWPRGTWVPVNYGRIRWKELGFRQILWERQVGLCCWCHRPMTKRGNTGSAATIEHIKPLCDGGRDHPSNLALAHARCNHERRERGE